MRRQRKSLIDPLTLKNFKEQVLDYDRELQEEEEEGIQEGIKNISL